MVFNSKKKIIEECAYPNTFRDNILEHVETKQTEYVCVWDCGTEKKKLLPRFFVGKKKAQIKLIIFFHSQQRFFAPYSIPPLLLL